MKRTILILLALLTLIPAVLHAQQNTFSLPSFGIGFHVGVGGMVPTGSLADELKGTALFNGGLDVESHRLKFRADISYAQPSLKKKNPYDVYDDQGRDLQLNATSNPTLLCFSGQVGYSVWRQGKVSVSPMVGFTESLLSWNLNDIKYEKDDDGEERPLIENVTSKRKSRFGWTVSVDVDIKLHGKLVDFPSVNDRQSHYTSSLRISPFVNILSSSSGGCCMGLTVSYAGMLHTLSRE